MEHSQNLYTFTSLLSDFGGLFEFIVPIFALIGKWINDHHIMGKIIRALYYTRSKKDRSKNRYLQMQSIKFSFKEKLSLLCRKFTCNWQYKGQEPIVHQRLFLKGEQQVKNELNLYTILESIIKIKASLAVLVEK